ncbi:MAG: hypothetical protein DCF22_00605 [Leptolyngbya sp.]|nr:MAG: hypothetical protein DCF22_00605 [Leptolyngbya sp.]
MKYTTQGAIALRLSRRLQVGGAPTTYGKDVLDLALLDLIVPQCEARFEAALSSLYQLPLLLSDETARAIASSIVEKMILGEVLPVHFFPEVGKEGGLRKVMADESAAELRMVKEGQVRLTGEKISGAAAGGYPYSNSTRVVRRGSLRPGAAEKIEW